ncbi:MAG: DUF4411 family protein [Ignavibacteriales bacterium]|nr:DUF4411 family protein [Ignavibacteriales bacterium]
MYSVDTNVFIDWWERRYPPDVFPSIQKAIEQLIISNKLFAPMRVREEINDVGSPELKQWAKMNKTIFVQHEEELQEFANKIQFDYPDLIDNTTLEDEADRWIIALAKMHSQDHWIVVTHETPFKKKRKPDRKMYIPDVCRSMNIECVEFLKLMRKEGWKF